MDQLSWLQILIFLLILLLLALPFGEYMAKVFTGTRTFLTPIVGPLERWCYQICKIDQYEEMDWKSFLSNLLLFNGIGLGLLFLLQEAQQFLPFNPEQFPAVRWDTALNAAISYVTNTNWQSYKSETTMSYLTQMLGFGVQNFLAAATSMTMAIALINGFIRKNCIELGNCWVYLIRAILYILLPLALVGATILLSQGCIENLRPYVHAQTLEGAPQVIAQGPVASQVAIKLLGTSGGGFFTANSAHPYENPTPFTDYLSLLALFLIAAAFPFTFGSLAKNRAQGIVLFGAMLTIFLGGLALALWAEGSGNSLLSKLGVAQGLNMEGKEVRFGPLASIFFAQASTATTTGALNLTLDSTLPLTGLVTLFTMALGGSVFGGAGSGLNGVLFYAILTMFLIGLMIGRTPEIYGKKLGPYEMALTITVLFVPALLQLTLSSLALATKFGAAAIGNPASRGLAEIMYTYMSTVYGNGSAFSGLASNTPFYNLTTAFAMLVSRGLTMVCTLALAGSLGTKKLLPINTRFPTTSLLFSAVLIGVIVINGALTFFPGFALGPILEHFQLMLGPFG